MRRRRSSSAKVLTDLYEMAGVIWQVGAGLSVALALLALAALYWALTTNAGLEATALGLGLSRSFGWILYAGPLTLYGLSALFGCKAYVAHQRDKHMDR